MDSGNQSKKLNASGPNASVNLKHHWPQERT
jgi:hypothetical protein